MPKIQQCACQIHTQQQLYLTALKMYLKAMHPAGCKCECAWCKIGCSQWVHMCENLGNFSQCLACDKVDLLGGDAEGTDVYMGRMPACVASDCANCGFDNDGGIPKCSAWDEWGTRTVGWIRFEDMTLESGTEVKKQQVPVQGTLNELWAEFRTHTKKVSFSCSPELACRSVRERWSLILARSFRSQ